MWIQYWRANYVFVQIYHMQIKFYETKILSISNSLYFIFRFNSVQSAAQFKILNGYISNENDHFSKFRIFISFDLSGHINKGYKAFITKDLDLKSFNRCPFLLARDLLGPYSCFNPLIHRYKRYTIQKQQ
jgi:hypothetical protein